MSTQTPSYYDYLKQSHGPEKARQVLEQSRIGAGGIHKKTYRGRPIARAQDTHRKVLTRTIKCGMLKEL